MSEDAPDELVRAVEAVLFAAEEPMSAPEISEHLAGVDVREALTVLSGHYEGRGVELVKRGQRWHFQTAPDLAQLLRREHDERRRLSRAATECLAIIAYHEPVSRAEIESIRGVQTAKGTLDVLMEAGWVRVAGRRDVPGRPVIYATTPDFLTHFGLKNRGELPGLAELRASGLLEPVEEAMERELADKADEAVARAAEANGGDSEEIAQNDSEADTADRAGDSEEPAG